MSNGESHSLLLVHGRGFKPSQEAWLDLSLQSMRAGIVRDYPDCVSAFDVLDKYHAYYGDLTNTLLQECGGQYDEQIDIGDRQNVLAELRKIDVRKRFGIRQYDRLPGKSALPEFVVDIGAPLLGAFGLTMPILKAMAKDFAAYLQNELEYAEQVRCRVRDRIIELFEKGDRILLISHGTGSAIVYDVLWQLSHQREYKSRFEGNKVDTWVTLGSPLGDRNIRKYLYGAKEKLAARFPNNVISWQNVSAEDDFTCHDNTLADDFKKMMDHHVVSAVHDYQVFNLAVRYGKSNPHSSIGYYIHPRVAKIISDWIGVEPT
jgi:hypothetical protein